MRFYNPRKTKDNFVKGHKYYLVNGDYIDLTLIFGEGNEPKNENDERLKYWSSHAYIPYDIPKPKWDTLHIPEDAIIKDRQTGNEYEIAVWLNGINKIVIGEMIFVKEKKDEE